MRKKVFWYHYNKPQSLKEGKPKITIHQGGVCHIVDNIVCNTPTYGHLRKEQPRFVVKGRGELKIENNIGYID